MKKLILGGSFLALFVVLVQGVGGAQIPASETQLLAQVANEPANVAHYLDLAKLYVASGRLDEAEQMLNRAAQALRQQRQMTQMAGAQPGYMSPQAPLRVGGDIREPKKIRDVKPVYPAIAQTAGVQGVVILEVVIDPNGDVSDARILRSVPLLDEAAIDAVRQWRFTQTYLNGVAVPVIMTVTVNFTLG